MPRAAAPPTPAPAPPTPAPAPKGPESTPALPADFKVPSLDKLVSDPPPTDQPGHAKVPPTPPVAPVPPVPKDGDDGSQIESEIIPGAKPQPTKKDSDFARERRENKDKKIELEQAIEQLGQSRAEVVRLQAEFDRINGELEQTKKRSTDLEGESTRLRTEREEIENRYFQRHAVSYDGSADPEFQEASTGVLGALKRKFPSKVPGEEGDKRIFPERLLADPQTRQNLEVVLGHYLQARENADEPLMERALNTAAQILGADVRISKNPDEDQLLDSDHPVLREIEDAFKEAEPHLRKKLERSIFIRDNAPRLATERMGQRTAAIRKQVAEDVLPDFETCRERLKKNPNDTASIIAMTVHRTPQLKEIAEAIITRYTKGYAAMSDDLHLPTLTSNNPAEIAAHRQQLNEIQQIRREAMKNGPLAELAGLIIPTLIAQRDAAERRADEASFGTNPGSGKIGGSGDSSQSPGSIPTEIMPSKG